MQPACGLLLDWHDTCSKSGMSVHHHNACGAIVSTFGRLLSEDGQLLGPKMMNVSGGPSRNRTGVQGFAVLCVTTPPSGREAPPFQKGTRAVKPPGSLYGNSRGPFDQWRLARNGRIDMTGLKIRCITVIQQQ